MLQHKHSVDDVEVIGKNEEDQCNVLQYKEKVSEPCCNMNIMLKKWSILKRIRMINVMLKYNINSLNMYQHEQNDEGYWSE